MFLFDTDVVTNVLKKRPSPVLLAHLKQIQDEAQAIVNDAFAAAGV